MHKTSPQGFTLIELSIVLVIIGLIIGGVLIGTDMIKNAELRNIQKEATEMKNTLNTFRLKYNCLPGDCVKAYDYFGSEITGCVPGIIGYVVSACSGNGNGLISADGEQYYAWVHLEKAGMVSGHYSGTYGTGGQNGSPNGYVDLGIDVPRSKAMSNAGWQVYSSNGIYGKPMTTFLHFAGEATSPVTFLYSSVLTGHEAYSIDNKYDDSAPETGRILALNINACTINLVPPQYRSDAPLRCGLYFEY